MVEGEDVKYFLIIWCLPGIVFNFYTFTVHYFTRFFFSFAGVVFLALSKSSALGFLQKFFEGGVLDGGIEPGAFVLQSGTLSTKWTPHPN
jgi:hypothetical protein